MNKSLRIILQNQVIIMKALSCIMSTYDDDFSNFMTKRELQESKNETALYLEEVQNE